MGPLASRGSGSSARRRSSIATRGSTRPSSARAETLARGALRGGNGLARKDMFAVWEGGGVSTQGQRGYHLLFALSVRGILCQGGVVPRTGGPTREQYFVLLEEWAPDQVTPADPLAEYFFRYIASHGPAGARDFAWWSGLPLGVSRAAADVGIRSLCGSSMTNRSRSTWPEVPRLVASRRRRPSSRCRRSRSTTCRMSTAPCHVRRSS